MYVIEDFASVCVHIHYNYKGAKSSGCVGTEVQTHAQLNCYFLLNIMDLEVLH